ncbi:hypothetical protein [Microbacterium enclense]|uniref:hypothetical protein n=1 Tax=Microbacterium enclense TaxID=993073 RepID=UPI003F7FDF40
MHTNVLSRFRRPAADSSVRRARPLTTLAAGVALMSIALTGCATTVEATSTATPTTSVSASASATATTTTADSDGTSATTTAETIADTTAAAEAFLATLSDEQRDAVLYAYDDETKT